MSTAIDYASLFHERRSTPLSFKDYLNLFCENPASHLVTSQMLIFDAIRYFGYEIVVRAGEPVLSFKIFKDRFGNGTQAVFGQELAIKSIVDMLEAVGKEAGPPRGLVLVGPPASGKTNIVDLIAQSVEEYSKQQDVRLYTFSFKFTSGNKVVELRSSFDHSPLLLVPLSLKSSTTVNEPRRELFKYVQQLHNYNIVFPSFFQTASLDKRTLDIIESLKQNPKNENKSLYDIYQEYITVEELQFSSSQGKGITSTDDMRNLHTGIVKKELDRESLEVLSEHIPGYVYRHYEGAIVGANRGLIHIHDAFTTVNQSGPNEHDYKPLLMLLGSGKVALESTQTAVDTTVFMTTNLEEMNLLENQFTSSKIIDRIERISINYLLDYNSELNILERDLGSLRNRYDIDPNLLRIASYFSVLTRLLPPNKGHNLIADWSYEKRDLYSNILPEQKLFLYAYRAEDPINTIRKLPLQHSFRGQAVRLGLDLNDQDALRQYVVYDQNTAKLEASGVFRAEDLKRIDDEFMRILYREHFGIEGRYGMSVRQLQNMMRNTLAASDGIRVLTTTFIDQLEKALDDTSTSATWKSHTADILRDYHEEIIPCSPRQIGNIQFEEGEGYYNDFEGLLKVVKGLYHNLIARHITIATVDRNPVKIESDLRRYLQFCCLVKATTNKAFSHIMIPRFSFVDAKSGQKIEAPDFHYMETIEEVLFPDGLQNPQYTREQMAEKLLDLISSGEIKLAEGIPLVNSRNDGLLNHFMTEYSHLLSNRKVDERLNPEKLTEFFFLLRSKGSQIINDQDTVHVFGRQIIHRMRERFRYSEEIALDTIIYSIRNGIINFVTMLR